MVFPLENALVPQKPHEHPYACVIVVGGDMTLELSIWNESRET